jgi:integrase
MSDGRVSSYVFPSTRSKTGHIGVPKKAWERLLGRSQLSDLILHDLRRTLGSWQARNGASLVMIGKTLNHKTPEATAIYARLDLDPVRQSVNGATSAMFEAAGVKTKAKVIPMPGGGRKGSKRGSKAA